MAPVHVCVSIGENDGRTAMLFFLLKVSDYWGRCTMSTYRHWPKKWPRRLHFEYTSWIHACKGCRELGSAALEGF